MDTATNLTQTPLEQANLDRPFVVRCVHRLRFTRDVFGSDKAVLAALLEPSGERPARVQIWLDDQVGRANPSLVERIHAFVRAYPHLALTGSVRALPGGEAIKNDTKFLERLLKAFNQADLDRRSYVVVIGGGAVLDAVGFAAAIAHRGIRLVRLPTTTLGQADSGIGVKNGVNLFGKKNWVGSFAVPWGVVNDAALLTTLPDRDFRCGFAEAVKVTLLKDAPGFDQLCQHAARIRRRDLEVALPAIALSARWHLDHITLGGDPFEANEARPLDFGHWSAHKLEVMTQFRVRHGEAVSMGVALDSVYSTLRHGFPHEKARRVLQCLHDLGLPLTHPALSDTATLFAGMEEFRQHLGGRLTLTMLRDVGQPLDIHEIDHEAMSEALVKVRAYADALGCPT